MKNPLSISGCPSPRHTLFQIIILFASASWAYAIQDSTPSPTLTQAQAKIEQTQALQSTDDDIKSNAVNFYKKAVDLISQSQVFRERAEQFRQLASDAPTQLASIRAELSTPPSEPALDVASGTPLNIVEQELTQSTTQLQAARVYAADLSNEVTKRNQQRSALTNRLIQVRQDLEEAQSLTSTDITVDVPSVILDAQNFLERTRVMLLRQEIDAIEAELASYDARQELLPARRDRAQRRVIESEKLVAAWQRVVTSTRQAEAQKSADEALRLRREAARQHPVLKEFAEQTLARANALVQAQNENEASGSTTERLERSRAELAALESKFDSVKARLNASGLNRATGLLLRNQYDSIPNIAALDQQLRITKKSLDEIDYALIELQEERDLAGDIDLVAQSLLFQIQRSSIPVGENNSQNDLLQVAQELATARRDQLDQLISVATKQYVDLDSLDSVLTDTLSTARSYEDYIEQRILWVRSISSGRFPSMNQLQNDTTWLVNPSSWKAVWNNTQRYIQSHWKIASMILGLYIIGVALTFKCKLILKNLSERVSRFATDSFKYSIAALTLSLLITAPLPAAMLILGWLLKAPDTQPQVALSIGNSLIGTAALAHALLFLRRILRAQGLGLAHFRWTKDRTQPIRTNIRWFLPAFIPLAILVSAIDSGGTESLNASLGRTLFTAEMILLLVFLQRILRPSGKVLCKYLEENKSGWIHRLRYIWYMLVLLLPITFGVLSWLGFHYTAIQLESRFESSLILVLALVVASSMMNRWLYVARRRVAVEDAKRRRAQAEQAQNAGQGTGQSAGQSAGQPQSTQTGQPPIQSLSEVPASPATLAEEGKIDLPALSEQTKQLIKSAVTVTMIVGMFIIWAQALPALRMFDQVQVWPTIKILESNQAIQETASQSVSSSSPNTTTSSASPLGLLASSNESDSQEQPAQADTTATLSITVADIGVSFITLLATWIAFRNIPGLIEIVVLQRLPLDSGSRYALSTVLRYLIAIIGILIAFQAIGISWSNVQWLAAALTFGLAFGLQEIFANFVSGLIILGERPIRIGDTVTVGNTTGTVMRIRMRATTITDWDRKELVIPNKTFITNDVINWSLTDPMLRVKIPIGVSYSSNADHVERTLYQITADQSLVLQDPSPQVIFLGFGDSTLNYEIRVFISSIESFIPVRHAINSEIFRVFQDEGIEIAFPQRDLHLRSIGDLSEIVDRIPRPKPE
ncbi:MAG: mechanosensitive ion channel domain-containing protein [Phycisphaerales bacterium]